MYLSLTCFSSFLQYVEYLLTTITEDSPATPGFAITLNACHSMASLASQTLTSRKTLSQDPLPARVRVMGTPGARVGCMGGRGYVLRGSAGLRDYSMAGHDYFLPLKNNGFRPTLRSALLMFKPRAFPTSTHGTSVAIIYFIIDEKVNLEFSLEEEVLSWLSQCRRCWLPLLS